ncbi:MAG: TonB family protein [Bryobacteraceae bacterium]|jgi:TonB family protein
MTNTTTPAESLGAQSAGAAFYRWEVPDKPVVIHISLDLVDRLEREALESFKAVTKRGSEIGGVFGGRVVAGAPQGIYLERYEPVECEYSRGPLYMLADADKLRLREAIERVKSGGQALVGCFRSNTRSSIALDEEDLALAQQFFSDPSQVFLLVRPFSMKPSLGAFFFWEGGRIEAEASYLQFPFKRAELLKSFANSIVSAPEKPVEAPAAPKEPLVMPKREERAPVSAPVSFKREEPKPAPIIPPPREQPAPPPLVREQPKPPVAPPPMRGQPAPPPPPPVLRREETKPPVVAPKREEPAPPPPPPPILKQEERQAPVVAPPKREERLGAPLGLKREERPPIVPVPPHREERAAGPAAIPKEPVKEPPAPPVMVRKEERPQAPPVVPVPPKREEKPAVTVKKEEKPVVAPIALKREEPPAEVEARPPVQPAAVKPAEVGAPARKEEPAPVKVQPAAAVLAEPVEGKPGLFKRLRWVMAAVVLLAAGGGYFYYRSTVAPPQQAGSPSDNTLGLKVERNAGQLQLSWNGSAKLIATATRATLSITDGDHREDVDLDLALLRKGSIIYSPISTDVNFRLEVTDLKSRKSVSESVRVLAGRPSPGVVAAAPSAAKPGPNPAEQRPAAPLSTVATAQPPAAQQPAAPPPPAPKVLAGPAVTAQVPRQGSLAERLRAPEQQEMPAPPTISSGGGVPSRPALPAQTPPAAAPAPVSAPAQAPTQQQQPAQQAQTPAPQAPAAPAVRTGGQVQEARLVQRIAPTYPPLARQTRVSGIVRVQAVIGKDGRVRRATAVSGPPLLRSAAVQAVQRWVYTPAMLNGETIEAETQVDINFLP